MDVKIVTKQNEKNTHEKMSNILPYNKDSLSWHLKVIKRRAVEYIT